jgi:hypothetical protein
MYNLFLDDFRSPECLKDTRDWEIVRSYQSFIDKITKDGLPIFISFDHDLSDVHYPTSREDSQKPIDYQSERYSKEKTGYHCVVWLINYCQDKKLPLPNWQVHSMNPVGRVNINQLLRNYREYEQRQSNSEG